MPFSHCSFGVQMKTGLFLFACGSLLLLGWSAGQGYAAKPRNKLLLVSFDGLRWDYPYRRPDLKSFTFLEENGVKADFLIPPYPSMTSPSHVTMATGLYAESHGVIVNSFFNKSSSVEPTDDYFTTLNITEWWDNDYEPIWATASTQGLKSGVCQYPGSNITVNGKKATRSYHLNDDTAEEWPKRIDTIMEWFRNENFDFVATYFSQPDYNGHEYGPYSSVITNFTLPLVDSTIHYLLQSVNNYSLTDELDIIFASDHGMSLLEETPISLVEHVAEEDIKFKIFDCAVALIEPMTGKKEKVYSAIKNANLLLDVFYKEEFPERFHFANNDRIPSIILVAYSQQTITWNSDHINLKGNHAGYDNMIPEMRSIFYMIGPSFKKNFKMEGFESIHIYELMCKLLGLKPAPNNGSLEVLEIALLENTGVSSMSSVIAVIVMMIAVYSIWKQ